MINLSRTDIPPSVETVAEILRGHNSMCPLYYDLDVILYRLADTECELQKVRKEIKERYGKTGTPTELGKYIKLLVQQAGLECIFETTSTGNLSLDKGSIAKAKALAGDNNGIITLLTLYERYASLSSDASKLSAFALYPQSSKISRFGHRMVEIIPEWVPQVTGRIAMTRPAIQNTNRTMQDLLCAPQGYVALHCDSSQVDPRVAAAMILDDPQITKLIQVQGDAYMAFYRYCELSPEDIASGRTDFEYEALPEDVLDIRQKLKAETNGVIYGKSAPSIDDPVVSKYYERIGNHPNMLAFKEQIKEKIVRNDYTVYTYFGTPLNILESDKLHQDWGNYFEKECIKLATNYTIQGTAADLMRFSVMEAHKAIAKTKQSYINFYVHDAGYFLIHEDDLSLVQDTLETVVSYNVDNGKFYVPSDCSYDTELDDLQGIL